MLAHERKQFIIDRLYKNNVVKVSDLSEMMDTSEVTIRRDLQMMEEEGLLRRTHGGAIRTGSAAFEPRLTELAQKNINEKLAIAKVAYDLICDNDAIIIDSSSTGNELATLIRENPKKRVTVVTNSMKTAWDLMDLSHVELLVVGGQVRGNIYSIIGEIAEKTLSGLRVDKAFIGINGVDFSEGVGLTTPNLFESTIKRAMMNASKQVYVLADSSKFNVSYLSIVCPVSRVDFIITDSNISKEILEEAAVNGVDLIIAQVSGPNKKMTEDEA